MIDTQAIRNKVLDLALRGKLTEQQPEDGTAEELFHKIQHEKQVLPKSNLLSQITAEEKPFEIPVTWKWVKLADIIFSITAGKSIRCNESTPANNQPGIIKVSAVTWGTFREEESKTCLSSSDWVEEYRIQTGDFLLSRANTEKLIAACVIVENINKRLMLSDKILRLSFSEYINKLYALYAMRSPAVREQIESKATGTSDSMRNISQGDLKSIVFPLPPLGEQQRVVDKIQSIYDILDTIDALQAKYHDNLTTLKSKLIDAGIQGKLTEQLPEDGTAEELYQQIQQEKQALIKEGKIKKEKPFSTSPVFMPYPFEIPDNWCFVRFGDLMINRDSERIPVSVADRRKRGKIYDYYGASGVIDKIDDYLFDKDLLLLGEDGANLLARSTPIAFIASGKYWVNNHAHVLDVCAGVELKYICYYINAISLTKYVTGSAQPKMNQENMNAIWVAVPPLAEQKRIVAKLEELLPLCE